MRRLRKLTQVQLSKRLGIDQSTLSDIERGANFSAQTLIRLSEELQTSPYWIMHDADESSLLEGELLSHFRKLSDANREALLTVARSFAATAPISQANGQSSSRAIKAN